MTNIDMCLYGEPNPALQPAHISPNRSFYFKLYSCREEKNNFFFLQLSILVYFEAQVYIFSTLTF